jgi:hypothetical protein
MSPSPRKSKRFTQTPFTRWLVMGLLVLIALGLVGTVCLVTLSIIGLTPGA